ncbi:SNF2 family N-terminal domain-containing protein [Diplogelasinospora grovesii]|uniref:SNF2 family N-terminal domain-containing protein n=1 Tax=Diplogelasinospora grovesii TaxID=303347 RepID=A0AAN6N875_9PEZI|nr:SNF2 family N-terminal domain-containing protein [Diplogelasinospora grovesii]
MSFQNQDLDFRPAKRRHLDEVPDPGRSSTLTGIEAPHIQMLPTPYDLGGRGRFLPTTYSQRNTYALTTLAPAPPCWPAATWSQNHLSQEHGGQYPGDLEMSTILQSPTRDQVEQFGGLTTTPYARPPHLPTLAPTQSVSYAVPFPFPLLNNRGVMPLNLNTPYQPDSGSTFPPSPVCRELSAFTYSETIGRPAIPANQAEDHFMEGYASPELNQSEETQCEVVCFGRIPSISGKCEQRASSEIPAPFPVQLDSSDRFSSKNDSGTQGRISSEHGQMIQGLLDENSLHLFTTCSIEGEAIPSRKPGRVLPQLPCTLNITVYGPKDLFDEIGSWFQEYDIYLQDPLVCHLDVRYCNPQRLSADDIDRCPNVSEVIRKSSGLLQLRDLSERPDLLEVLSSSNDLEESSQPSAISTELKRHQKQALTFMLRREQGWAFGESSVDMWEYLDTERGQCFVNRISGDHQSQEPTPFYGGIIADPMGLGKTLTMIALAATDLDGYRELDTYMNADDQDKPHVSAVSATLIIVPPPLMGTWEEQLSEHVVDGALEYRRHHSKNRLTDLKELDRVNVVLTTYHTVSAEWKSGNVAAENTSVLFSVRWKRIVLDEAHFIRNGNSRMARAACALDSVSRWAVTGTPIQNRLSDLATLLKFIRAHPYDDPTQFETDITRLWKAGDDEEAVKRLKCLSACLLLRRAKATITLPPRRDMQCPVDFNREERALYDILRQQAITKIDEALHKDSEASRASVYVNVLQQIESLRLVCNLGLHYNFRHDNPALKHPVSGARDQWSSSVAQQTFNVQREMAPIICLQCSSSLELTETLLDGSTPCTSSQQSPWFFQCLRFVCGDCVQKLNRTAGRTLVCGHKPLCPKAPVSISGSVLEEIPDLDSPQPTTTAAVGLPSKVEALVADIKTLPEGVKCIVFSTWRLTLDIVENGLHRAGIRTTRFDGKVPQKDRQRVVDSFKTDASIRVMLLTLSCGAVGLTLTVASRAYLMEPHWNPTLEEQALARIHRIGQTRDVTTVRFYVRDSFEERVMEVQETKKHLAGVLLSPHDGGQTDDCLGGLHKLRALL